MALDRRDPPLARDVAVLGGVFVGGASRRMAGRAKGLLTSPEGVPLVERTIGLFEAARVPWVLVGVRDEYAHLACAALADAPAGIGPLGGLLALLHHARAARVERVVAVACDMPFLTRRLLARLVDAPAEQPIVTPLRDGRWEPLFARYDVAAVLPVAEQHRDRGTLSLQALLAEVGAAPLATTADDEAQLDDWDSPEDIGRARRSTTT